MVRKRLAESVGSEHDRRLVSASLRAAASGRFFVFPAQQSHETSFDEMQILGQGFPQPQVPHHEETQAIGERPRVVTVLEQERRRSREALRVVEELRIWLK